MGIFSSNRLRAAHAGTLAVLLAACPASDDSANQDAGDQPADGAPLPFCEGSPRARFGACVRYEDSDPSSDQAPESFTGVVEAIERPEILCGGGLGNAPRNNEDGKGYSLTIREGHTTATVGIYLPWRAPLVAVGDTVTLEYSSSNSIEWGMSGSLALRDQNGELLLWVLDVSHGTGQHGEPDELSIRDGEEMCVSRAPSCQDVRRGLIAESDESPDVAIEPGEMADVGDYVVLLGSNTAGMCDFATSPYYHAVTTAAVRGSMEALAEREHDMQD